MSDQIRKETPQIYDSNYKTEDLRSLAQRMHLLQHVPNDRRWASDTRFLSLGFLKDQVYENRPEAIAELKVAITQKIRAFNKEECVRVIDNFARRL